MQGKLSAIALPSILNCYNDNQPKNLNIKPMSTYSEVLSQAQNLTLEEQQQLLEVLSALVRDRVTTQTQGKRSEIDAALIEMVQDPEYQAQVLQMEAEFAVASWEALQLGESPV
jgi:hypothetical protein